MGIYDRDWHKAERHQQRISQRVNADKLARAYKLQTGFPWWPVLCSTIVYSLAVYGAVHLIVTVSGWASG